FDSRRVALARFVRGGELQLELPGGVRVVKEEARRISWAALAECTLGDHVVAVGIEGSLGVEFALLAGGQRRGTEHIGVRRAALVFQSSEIRNRGAIVVAIDWSPLAVGIHIVRVGPGALVDRDLIRLETEVV